MAILIKADGTKTTVTPAHGRAWTLAELQALVGGYIEAPPWLAPLRMVWNEEGTVEGLRVNVEATALVMARLRESGRPLRYHPTLVGDVVVLADDETF